MQNKILLPTNHTFVICAYGESPYLEECVASVVNQTEKSNVLMSTSTMNEHIISIAEKYGIELFHNTGKGDMQDNWNFGISCAETDFVTVCHQDDYYKPDYFSQIKPKLKKDLVFLHTDYYDVLDGREFRNFNNKMRLFLNLPLRSDVLDRVNFIKKNALRFGNSICCPSCTYNVGMLQKPLFVSTLKNACDWELFIKLSEKKGATAYVPKAVCCKRTHAASITANDIINGQRAKEDKIIFNMLWPKTASSILLSVYKKIYKFSV